MADKLLLEMQVTLEEFAHRPPVQGFTRSLTGEESSSHDHSGR
jgi:hypothetical protein